MENKTGYSSDIDGYERGRSCLRYPDQNLRFCSGLHQCE